MPSFASREPELEYESGAGDPPVLFRLELSRSRESARVGLTADSSGRGKGADPEIGAPKRLGPRPALNCVALFTRLSYYTGAGAQACIPVDFVQRETTGPNERH
jgi:hypothetical protein